MTTTRLLETLAELGGVARRAQVASSRAQRRAIDEAVRAGSVKDLGAGWIARADTAPAIVRARRLNATITCVSAAEFYGIATLHRHEDVHLAIPRSRGDRATRSRATRGTELHRESVCTRPADPLRPIAPIDEVLLRALRCLTAEEAIVMVDSAVRQRLVTVEELDRQLMGPGSPEARARLARCDGRSRSASETVARLVLRAAGLPVEPGVVITGVGEVDLLVAERVVVECDGFAYHSGRREFRNDRRRDRELVARGYVVLRFTWEDVMHHPAQVVDAVLRVLERLG
jgi:PIN domain nuclease of toxin-antitoxin system